MPHILTNPQNLNWIFLNMVKHFSARFLISLVLQRVQDESPTQKSIDVAVEFLKEISTCFQVCYQNIQDIKCLNKKMVHLERSFETLSDDLSIKKQMVFTIKFLWLANI